MSEATAFLHAIADNLYDDAPRLIFADWLEEHGDPDRAEFIRIQCELEPMRDQYEIDRAAELHHREEELLQEHQQEWLGQELEGWHRWREDGASAEFQRGFVDTIAMPVRTFLDLGANARRRHPTIRRVVLFRVNGQGEQLAASPALGGLAELELAGWYSDADAEATASSLHLARLEVLELWLGRRGRLRDARLCRIMAGAKAWPRLRELTLLNPNDENQRGRKRLVKVADEAAGRNVAVYRRGWPELFPFAADYYYTFPGYLPDGRMAMAVEDHHSTPPTLCVITFDGKGKQTTDVITVAPPDDLFSVDNWFQHKDQISQHLTQTIGLRPG
ncbi:MAG: TIGR02996 domain-containing protein, partial [Gemmataceae bacterium]